MFPVGAVLAAAMMATRAGATASTPSSQQRPNQPVGTALVVLGLVFVAVIHLASLEGRPFTVYDFGFQLALALIGFPWFFARRIFIPLGLVRTAYVFGWLSGIRFKLDRKGGAALAAAWALCHRRKNNVALAAFVERRLSRCTPLRGAGVTAVGLLCAARGDLIAARQILASVRWMALTVCPDDAARFAGEWLAADAASDGRWLDIIEMVFSTAAVPVMPTSAVTRFLAVAAGRLLGKPARNEWSLSGGADRARQSPPTRAELAWRWLVARERLETWALFRRAWDAGVSVADGRPGEPPVVDGGEAQRALAAHAFLLARGPAAVDVVAVARRWDEALESASLRRLAAERALSLAAPSGEAALSVMRAAVEADLARALASDDGLLPVAAGGVLARAVAGVRNQLLQEVETLSGQVRQRAVDKRVLPGVDEWREVIALRTACERVLRRGGPELMRLAFAKVHPDACKLAVWLWNERGERAIANALFTWLHALAHTVEDAESEALQAKNVNCGAM